MNVAFNKNGNGMYSFVNKYYRPHRYSGHLIQQEKHHYCGDSYGVKSLYHRVADISVSATQEKLI